ncbi:MAG TPA: M48 family metallopeptidase [Terriglobales bacterium]|nr:M48 family metallopeptidase [Terriglobales bacterium]
MTKNRAVLKGLSLLTTLCLLVSQAVGVTGGPELPNPGKAPLTHDQQIQLGLKAASQVYQQMPVLPDNSPETQYIRQLGAKLEAVIPKQYSWPYEFHVIPQKEINAFALPGGQVFVNVGTIAAAQNEGQLAGVMAHEMSHVYMQHSAKQAGKTQTTAALAGIAGAILGAAAGGVIGSLAQAGINFGAQGIILKYSREDEAQADAVGAIIMYKAGYNPRAMADFFKLLASEGGAGPQFLSDHPNPGNREQAIQQEIANWPPKTYVTSSPAFQQAHQQASAIKVYTAEQISAGAKNGQWARLNRQNGAVFGPNGGAVVPASESAPAPIALSNVLPNQHMVSSDLGFVNIARPDNWQLTMPRQTGESIRIAPSAGVAGNNVGYGVIIDALKAQPDQPLDQVTSNLVSALQSGGDDLQPVGSAQPISVGGAKGLSVKMQSTSPFPDADGQSQKERDWLVTAQRSDGSVVYMVFVAPESQWDKFSPAFDSMLKSVRLQ